MARNEAIKKFATEIKEKGCEKLTKNGEYDHSIMEAIRQMVEHKMIKELWVRL